MARGVNKVILIGNLGRDPEVRATAGGVTVTNLRVATSEAWNDKATGERKEATEWHSVVLFGRLAEVAGEYLAKGRRVYIEGRLQTRKWQDKDGADRYSTEVVASEMQMLGGSDGPQEGLDSGGGAGARAEVAAPPQRAAPAAQGAAAYRRAKGGGGGVDFDDDLPF